MKTVFFVSLAITAVVAESLVCQPGSLFKVSCNTCTCSKDGLSYACTDNVCPPEIVLVDELSEVNCTPGSLFKVGCNTCTCAKDGKTAACTDMLCPPTNKAVERSVKQVCQPNSQFKDYCNTCYCNEDGTQFGCTFMECDKNIWNKDGTRKDAGKSKIQARSISTPEQVCEPRSTFKKFCNTCFCSADGQKFACTEMFCDEGVWNEDGTSKLNEVDDESSPKEVCAPSTTFKDYCNTCSCSDDGLSFECTKMYCDKDLWNKDGTMKVEIKHLPAEPKQVCTPRATFKDYCNTCFCAANGMTYACTRKFCDERIWNKNGTMKYEIKNRLAEDSTPKEVCTPRSTFKDYCNICSCSDDGLSYACTKMHCDKDLWNKDGTMKAEIKYLPAVPKQVCTPGSNFKDYCNLCGCSADGSFFTCTKMQCDKNIWNKNGTLKIVIKNLPAEESAPKQVCTPKSTFKDYCNTCGCSDDGLSYACTKMYCDKDLWNKDGTMKVEIKNLPNVDSVPKEVCTPGTTFKDYCNTCGCSDDGSYFVCTKMQCDKNIWNKDGSMKVRRSLYTNFNKIEETQQWGPLYKQGDECTPGRFFYSECNRCICSKSGKSAFCTFMTCQEEAVY